MCSHLFRLAFIQVSYRLFLGPNSLAIYGYFNFENRQHGFKEHIRGWLSAMSLSPFGSCLRWNWGPLKQLRCKHHSQFSQPFWLWQQLEQMLKQSSWGVFNWDDSSPAVPSSWQLLCWFRWGQVHYFSLELTESSNLCSHSVRVQPLRL